VREFARLIKKVDILEGMWQNSCS